MKQSKGFSLIELIIVVAVIGILVAIGIPIYGNITEKARRSAVSSASKHAATTIATRIESDQEFNDVFTDHSIHNIIVTPCTDFGEVNTALENICVRATREKGEDIELWAEFGNVSPSLPRYSWK